MSMDSSKTNEIATVSSPTCADLAGIRWCHLQTLGSDGKHNIPKADPDAQQAILRCYFTCLKQLQGRNYDPTDSDVLHYRSSEAKQGERLRECGHGFYSAFHAAWATHGAVVLSPDDVWLAVQLQFCKYMDANATQMRDLFVEHQDTVELNILMECVGQWELFMQRLMSAIQEKCKANVAADFLPSFSSSTELSNALQRLAVMDGMQHFVTYRSCRMCGIARVGFLGTLDDWQLLRAYVLGLARFHLPDNSKYFSSLKEWVDIVVEIVDHFLVAYKGEQRPSLDFWNRVINIEHVAGSGSLATYLDGWITTFLTGGHYSGRLNVAQIPALRYNVPVTVDDNGYVYRVRVLGGFTGVVEAADGVWRPQTSLVVIKVGEGEEPGGRVKPSAPRSFAPVM